MPDSYGAAVGRFARALLGHDRFLILTHRRPDGDTVGSAAALCRMLRAIGKTAYLAENPEMLCKLKRFIAEITAGEGYSHETVVSVDVSAPGQLPDAFRRFLGNIDFVIDHHAATTVEAKTASLCDPSAAATGEIVFDLGAELGIPLDRETAEAVYAAISTDTGCFLYSNTTARTHRVAACVMDVGIDLTSLNRELFENRSRARIELERMIYNGMRFYADDRIAVIAVTLEMKKVSGATDDDTDDLSALPRKIEGVDAGITVYELPDGGSKVSLRTSERIDAAAVCAEFGGGGHVRAAGCSIKLPPKEAAEAVVKKLEVYF